MATDVMSLEQLKAAIKKDVRESNNQRDLAYAVLGNFSTDVLVEHVLTHRETRLQLIERLQKL